LPRTSASTTSHRVTHQRPPMTFLDRDHSILAFNERVLDWARRVDVPLLERLRYLSIVSSNLDEFFEVRMAPQVSARKTSPTAHREAETAKAHRG